MGIKAYVFKYQLIRSIFALIPSAETRSKLLKKFGYFKEMGENVHFQPRKMPADPKYIKLHNNVNVASDVTFVTHDIMHYVFNNLNEEKENQFKSHLGCIELLDNVFVGSGTIIMPDVRIGPNAIIAAGSIVTKDVPEGTVVAGVPAKVIGSFNDIMQKRKLESETISENEVKDRLSRVDKEWDKFYSARDLDDK